MENHRIILTNFFSNSCVLASTSLSMSAILLLKPSCSTRNIRVLSFVFFIILVASTEYTNHHHDRNHYRKPSRYDGNDK